MQEVIRLLLGILARRSKPVAPFFAVIGRSTPHGAKGPACRANTQAISRIIDLT